MSTNSDKYRIDSEKISLHPHRVAQWLDSRGDWNRTSYLYPLYVEISPVGACSHRCRFCAVDYIGYLTNQLDTHTLIQWLRDAATLGTKSVMFAGEGEPLLHKRLSEINATAVSLGIDTALTTNGVLLNKFDPAGMSWIKVSVNGGSKQTYANIHRTNPRDWDTVWKNIVDMAGRKGSTTLGVQSLMLPEVVNEAHDLARRARDSGADYLVLKPYSQHRFSETTEYEGVDISIWNAMDFTHLETETFKVYHRHNAAATTEITYDRCHATPNLWAYIMASGDVYSCSAYLLDERFRLGNINKESWRAIWGGERRKKNWQYVNEHLDISECRVNCRMDKCNRHLEQLLTQPHRNFI